MIKKVCCFVFAFECELSCVWLFATPWTTACQAPLSMGFSMEIGCHFLLQGNLPDLGIKSTSLGSPALAVDSLPLCHLGKPPNASSSVQFSSVAQLRPTLCDPMNQSTPGLPVHHQLPEFTQTHVHWVGDDIQPSHPLSSPSPPAPNPSQHQGIFQWVSSSYEVSKVLEFQMHPDIAKYPSGGRGDGKINPKLRHFGQGIKRKYNL